MRGCIAGARKLTKALKSSFFGIADFPWNSRRRVLRPAIGLEARKHQKKEAPYIWSFANQLPIFAVVNNFSEPLLFEAVCMCKALKFVGEIKEWKEEVWV
jgi:hypothetical protein